MNMHIGQGILRRLSAIFAGFVAASMLLIDVYTARERHDALNRLYWIISSSRDATSEGRDGGLEMLLRDCPDLISGPFEIVRFDNENFEIVYRPTFPDLFGRHKLKVVCAVKKELYDIQM